MAISMSQLLLLMIGIAAGFFLVVAATVYVQMPVPSVSFWLSLILPWQP